jgi:hypothetical protein
MATKEKAKKKKIAKGITAGVAHIQASFNNTIITIADKQGNVLVLRRLEEINSLCRADRRHRCGAQGQGYRLERS